MKSKTIQILIPVITGIASVIFTLALYNLIVFQGTAFQQRDNAFWFVFLPIIILIATIFQIVVISQFGKKHISIQQYRFRHIVLLFLMLCLIPGVCTGLLFSESSLGMKELLTLSLWGTGLFIVYWSVNLLILRMLYKQTSKGTSTIAIF